MIRFTRVSKSYDAGRTFAVREVSFHVPAGTLLVLLGESGCGKTTTLKMINRLHQADEGEIVVDGKNVREVDPVRLRRGIGYVFQMIGLFPHMTVGENVATVPRLLGWPSERIERRVDELLEMVNLEPERYRNRYPRELSGGQRQRVGFARALAASPSVMLLDEPFGALDPVTRDGLQTEFRTLQRRLGFTAVMVTHDMTEALLMADQIAVMQSGRVLQLGTPRELLSNPAHPYVETLLSAPRHSARRLEQLMQGSLVEAT